MKPGKYSFFNILRFVSAICIAGFLHYYEHLLGTIGIESPYNENVIFHLLFKFSYVFTDLFFMMSGILFSYVYTQRIQKDLTIDRFIKGRYKRIFPLVIVTSILTYVGNFILFISGEGLFSQGSVSLWDLTCDVLFAGKAFMGKGVRLNAPIWYINVLLLCYVIAYIFARYENKVKGGILYVLPVVLGIMMQGTSGNYPLWNSLVSRGFIAFFAGILLNRYLEVIKKQSLSRKRILSIIIMIISLVGFMSPYKEEMIGEFTSYADFLIFIPLIILLYDCEWINKICEKTVMKWMGDISFGIYLFNFPILIFTYILLKKNIVNFNVTGMGTIIILIVVHIIIAGIWQFVNSKNSNKK